MKRWDRRAVLGGEMLHLHQAWLTERSTGGKGVVPTTFPSVMRCGVGGGTKWSRGPCRNWAVPWNDAWCDIQAKSSIQQDSGNSKPSQDVHMSPEGEAEVKWRVWSNERGVCYCTVQLRELWTPHDSRSPQVESASQLGLFPPHPLSELGYTSRYQD